MFCYYILTDNQDQRQPSTTRTDTTDNILIATIMIRGGGGGDDKHKLGWHVQTPVSHHSSQIQPNMLIRIEMVGSLHFTSTIQQHKYEQMSLTLSLLKGSTTCLAIIESLSSATQKSQKVL